MNSNTIKIKRFIYSRYVFKFIFKPSIRSGEKLRAWNNDLNI